MKVVVVAVHDLCPAAEALRSTRTPFELVLVEDDYTYGRTLQRYWDAGEPFINVEHDIVPWPGALEAMAPCCGWGRQWCGYLYPIGHSGKMSRAMGCVKFDPRPFHVEWATVPWNRLDAAVFRVLGPWHEHTPPVAHLTRLKALDPTQEPGK